ncbi:MAG: hypothetical protein U9N54_07685 [candidate division Zixibacteria bacterium]|nr:hypothetical protein [candidate division Zixibacteria bacterium]
MADLLPERFEFEPFYEGGPRPVVTRKEDEFFDRHGDYIGHWSQLEENTTNGVFTMFDAWLDAGEE